MGWSKDYGKSAKVNADYAKVQGDDAKQEASNLSQLKTDAEVATQNASTAAQNANTAKSNADNAASEAIAQANHAKNEGDRAKAEADRLAGTDVSVLDNKIGSLSSLNTTNKISVVESVNEVAQQLAHKADKGEVNSLATDKADKSYVDTQYSTLDTKINSQASGSPKGTYATLSALQTAFPTGNANIYVVSADGKWYYWNGSAWIAGGTYQSTGLADESVTQGKLQELVKRSIYGDFKPFIATWVLGSIANGINNNTITNRIRYDEYIKLTKGTVIHLSDYTNYKFSVARYSPVDRTYIDASAWNSSDYTLDGDYYVRLIMAYTNDATITSENIPTISSTCYYRTGLVTREMIEDGFETRLFGKNISLSWEFGGLNSGAETTANTNIRTDFIFADYPIILTLSDRTNYRYSWSKYDLNYNFISAAPTWLTSETRLEKGYYYRLVMRNTGYTAIASGDIPTYAASLNILAYIPNKNTSLVVTDGMDITALMQETLNNTKTFILEQKGTFYLNNTVKIPSEADIRLGKNTVLKLNANVYKPMFENNDPTNGNVNISIEGGIYDANNVNQPFSKDLLFGTFRFAGINGFKFKNLTIKDPINFGTQFCRISNFEVENIFLDYNLRNENMDGVHFHGKIYNGRIINVHGNTSDDLVALNADDILPRMSNASFSTQMEDGDIINVVVDGVHSDDGYRGMRVLTSVSLIDDLKIRNVSGRYINAGVLIGIFPDLVGNGNFGRIILENISAIAEQYQSSVYLYGNCDYIQITNVAVDVSADTTTAPIVAVANGYTVNHLNISNMFLKNTPTNSTKPLVNNGTINDLIFDNFISDTTQTIQNAGTITKFRSNSFTL